MSPASEATMKALRRVRRGALAGLAWIGLGVGFAHAGTITPTNPATLRLDAGAPVSVSLYQLDSALPLAITASSPSRCIRLGLGPNVYRDVTDCWLPAVGESVFVVVHGSLDAPTLVPPAPGAFPLPAGTPNPYVAGLTTSAYPGEYVNVGSGGTPDFTLGAAPTSVPTSGGTSVRGWELVPQDSGGMAVLQVGPHKVIAPGDGTATVAANGIPEIWENLYGGSMDPAGDIDTGPGASAPIGDGLSTFDEYRGALIAGKQTRFHPLQKDVVVHLVTGQCPTPTSPASLLLAGGYPTLASSSATLSLALPGGPGDPAIFTTGAAVFSAANVRGEIIGTAGGRARIIAVSSATTAVAEITEAFPATSISAGAWSLSESLFGNVYGLFSAERLRLLAPAPGSTNSREWVDNFASFGELTGLVLTAAGPTTDRVVNVNRLYGPPQKGVRVIECLDDSLTTPYGWAIGGVGSPNAIGNVILYTKRIVTSIGQKIDGGAPRKVQYSPMLTPVLKGGSPVDWLPKGLVGDGNPASVAVKNFVISRAMQFYVGMEVGHTLHLNVTASNDPHFAPFSGDGLDSAITSKPDKSTSGFNTFYIPTIYSATDQSQLQVK
jgi:hypothetical protein